MINSAYFFGHLSFLHLFPFFCLFWTCHRQLYSTLPIHSTSLVCHITSAQIHDLTQTNTKPETYKTRDIFSFLYDFTIFSCSVQFLRAPWMYESGSRLLPNNHFLCLS